MFFSVRDLGLRSAQFDVSIEPGVIDFLDPKLRQAGPLKAKGTAALLSHSEDGIHLQGALDVTMEADCDRCLEPATFPVTAELNLYYKPASETDEDEEAELDEGEAEIAFYEGGGIELNDVLREQILLTLPFKRICKEDCLGICPECGQIRNQVECGCEQKIVDPRWSALKEI
ncbi:MAG: DUF177 domain-containing protein [Bryobacteraceae bacterium]